MKGDPEFVLGIWDGHDAGAALVRGGELVCAVNEERLTRRKLEVGFPRLAIGACLEFAGLAPADIRHIAASTTDPAKTLTRLFPGLKEEYYLIRRRKRAPRSADPFKKAFKYRFTELPPNPLSIALSRRHLTGRLRALGCRNFRLSLVDHHAAHAAAAALCCGFPEALVMTLDGVGDGLCGTVRRFAGGRMELLRALPARTSLGIFFEHVTNLMNMRELEDEGKVMALANYAYPIPDEENPLLDLIAATGGNIVSRYRATDLFRELRRILWRYPSEQFAAMAQRVLEKCVLDLVREYVTATGLRRLAVAGGVFSNIKMNMKIAEMDEVERIYVFPHMGDGGLGIGAAMHLNHETCGVTRHRLDDLYLGPRHSRAEILAACAAAQQDGGGLKYGPVPDAPQLAARFILDGEIILWFRGRMEIGPRALGNRSILARPDNNRIKDRLNVLLKKRVWYQPFCPSILAEDGPPLLHADGRCLEDNPFMTMAFRVREEHLPLMAGVINIDGTCRPQFVRGENPPYRELLSALKRELGYGVVLNTSFNIHGEPLVHTPGEALKMLRQTGIRYLFLEDILVENLPA
ncbi:MAG TPA: carbamoyltransferase C-terminal domain-containing protein [Syntrophales bacterium]|nr:carbamoyltransferase C-terminal domain-containing protein [Syntrophales bacterium]HPC32517.1 carbamoyltransferase C-terminal domain-containing protein [Syntrophales bacterium]HQG34137.1 carbamoyltransferase C-terminal domain-containing protein [Syntrophales bacterium]HQI35309.1 carbamoyltransferase C-terminal domain-containing protein [Syntrophales bacterium]HRR47022.1 carbamoyltransferase C-terminal domain-containing protein [Syntrophales bacterium]